MCYRLRGGKNGSMRDADLGVMLVGQSQRASRASGAINQSENQQRDLGSTLLLTCLGVCVCMRVLLCARDKGGDGCMCVCGGVTPFRCACPLRHLNVVFSACVTDQRR